MADPNLSLADKQAVELQQALEALVEGYRPDISLAALSFMIAHVAVRHGTNLDMMLAGAMRAWQTTIEHIINDWRLLQESSNVPKA